MNEIDYKPIIAILCFGMAVLHLILILYYVKHRKFRPNFLPKFKRKQRVEDLQIIRPEFRAETKKEKERLERERRKNKLKIIK